jgi:hypothetical protein
MEARPAMKQANMAIRRLRTRAVGERNSLQTKTPQNAEIIVAPWPMEYEIAGPTKWTVDAAKLRVAPVTQIAPPRIPARCQEKGAAVKPLKSTGSSLSMGFFIKRKLMGNEQRAVPMTKKSAIA